MTLAGRVAAVELWQSPEYRARQSAARARRRASRDDLAWFMSRVQPEPNSGCWLWTGNFAADTGYGIVRGYPELLAHRLAYRLLIGPIPAGAFVLHRCDVRLCVNPRDLYTGDHVQNMHDMAQRRRADDRRGSRNTQARLIEADIVAIRESAAAGSRHADLARTYRVARSAISNICLRKSWTHV